MFLLSSVIMFNNCQLIEVILRYHKIDFDAPKTLLTRKCRFVKNNNEY